MTARTHHAWLTQALQPGEVHVMRVPTTTSGPYMAKAARQWAKRNGMRVQAVVMGDWLVTRWERP